MRKVTRLLTPASALGLFLACGCVDCREVMQKNTILNERLSQESGKGLELDRRLQDSQRLANILSREKQTKDQDLLKLRELYREYIRSQYRTLNDLLSNEELLDYYGGELLARQKDEGRDLTLVFQSPFEKAGRILRIRADAAYRTQFHLLILKPLEKDYLCIYQSPLLQIDNVGAFETVELPIPVHVQKGDLLGFYFPGTIGIFYDDATGKYSVFRVPGLIGERLDRTKAEGEQRNYSLGVLAVLE